MKSLALFLLLAELAPSTVAAAIDLKLYQAAELGILARDDTEICGGDSSLTQCGTGFPSAFCCPSSTFCKPLTTNLTAVICCPTGSDCTYIQPITCDKSAQNATVAPATQFHAEPPEDLQTCGSQCCPMGYECQGTTCKEVTTALASSITTSSTATSTTGPSQTGTASSAVSSQTSSAISDATIVPTSSSAAESSTSNIGSVTNPGGDGSFSGKSFAAGFVPGIFLGILATAALIWFLVRRRESDGTHVDNEKQANDDGDLTSMYPSPNLDHRPALSSNGRSISEPVARQSQAHRTEFSRGASPPRQPGLAQDGGSYQVEVTAPHGQQVTPQERNPRIRPLFSRSPQHTPKPTQSPLPWHMKRGTLSLSRPKSFQISPIRGLNRKKSAHSLRRHATRASDASDASTRRLTNTSLNRKASEASTGTIKMSFPEVAQYCSPDMRQPQQQHVMHTARNGETHDSDGYATSSSQGYTPQSGFCGFTPGAASSVYTDDGNGARHYTTSMIPPPIPLHIANPDVSGSSSSSSNSGNISNARPQLGSPYTPTKKPANATADKATKMFGGVGGRLPMQRGPARLGVPIEHDNRRDTTFSGMMRKAGIIESDLVMGPEGQQRR